MSDEITQVDADEIQDRLLLSTVQKIKKLCPIPGKDRVQKVEFENCGYTAIVEKGLHEEGDLVVFTKYDSIVAEIPPFEWMKDMKYRVKPKSFTIKDEEGNVTGKIYSQGIVIKLSEVLNYFVSVEPLAEYALKYKPLEEGEDLTLPLGTKKYIPAPPKGGGTNLGNMQSKGDFPSHIVSKTDEMNAASKLRLLERFKGLHVVGRLKMEGSSQTNLFNPDTEEFEVCSRNNRLKEVEGNKFWEAANKYRLREKLSKDAFKHICIQGELMGPGIQKNKLGLKEVDLFVFNAVDLRDKRRYTDDELIDLCVMFNLKIAPPVFEDSLFKKTFEELQEIADNLEYAPGVPAEGMVIRPVKPVWCPELNDWLSLKIINRNYSL